MRRVLETFAVRLAAEHATLEDLDELRAVISQMYAAAGDDDMTRMGNLDIEFHGLLCRSSHHRLLIQIWKSIEIGVRRCLALRHRIYRSPYDVIGTHPDILAALEAHDAERASIILDSHIAEAGDLLYRSWAAAAEPLRELGRRPSEAPPIHQTCHTERHHEYHSRHADHHQHPAQ